MLHFFLNRIWCFGRSALTVRSCMLILLLFCTHDRRCDHHGDHHEFASSSFSSSSTASFFPSFPRSSSSSSGSCFCSFSSTSSFSCSSSSLLFASALSWNTNPALTFNTPRPPGNALMSKGELTLNNTMTGAAEPQQAVAFWGGSVGNLTSQYLYLLPVANSSSSPSVLPSAFLTPFVFTPPRSDECTYNSTVTMVSSGTCLALICWKDVTTWSFFGLTTNEKLSWSRTFVTVPPLLGGSFGSGSFFSGGSFSVWTPANIVYFFTFQFSPVPFYAVDLTQFFDVIVSSLSSSSTANGFLSPLSSTIQFKNVTAYANSALGDAIIIRASLLYMESSNSIFLFGGQTNNVIPGAIFNDNLLKFSLSTSSWTVENVLPPSLLPRLASVSAAYMQYLVIYGGFGGVSSSTHQSAANVNDMWCYDTDFQSWAKIEFELDVVHLLDDSSSTMSNSQLALFGMTSSVVQGKWFLFGGQIDNYVSSSSLYRVSLADVVNQASFLRPHNSSTAPLSKTIMSYPSVVSMSELSWGVTGPAPSPRVEAQLIVSEDNRLFVYSGLGIDLFQDMYVLDLVTRSWTNITNVPSLPAARIYGTFTWIDEYNALLYGGLPAYDSNIYMFSIPHDRNSFSFKWNALSNNSSDSPAARQGHMAASLNGVLYIVGGFDANDLNLNDTWSFSRVEGWIRLADVTSPFTFLDGMVAFNNKLFVNFYSGQVNEYDPLTNVWSTLSFAHDSLSVSENGGIALFGSSVYVVDGDTNGIGLSEFAVFDLVLRTVSHPYTPSFTSASVASRTFVENSFVCQVALPRCFLFGGEAVNGSFLNDLNIMSVDIVNIDTAHGSDIGCVQSLTTPCKSLSGAIGFYSTSFLLPPLQFGLVQYTVNAISSTHAATLEAGFLGELGPGAVVINEPVLIQPSNDGPAFVLDCLGGRCLNINGATVTLKGFTVQNAGQGAVQVNQSGTLTLQDMKFMNNAGYFGGAIYLHSSDLSATNSHFDFHSAYQGGVVFASSLSTVQADGCTFSNNAVAAFDQNNAAYGGAIYAVSGSSIVLSNCVFVNNTATSSAAMCGLGGALFSLVSSVSMYECAFMNNSACSGGAIASIGVSATKITDVSSLLSSSSSLITQSSSLSSNKASSTGGAIYVSAVDVISLSESNFTANFAQLHGAAVFSDSKNSTSFDVSACIFRDNICKGAGGGIFWNPPPFAAPFVCSATSYNNVSFFQSQPLISNMSPQSNNIAVYGPWIASPPICLRWNFVNTTKSILYPADDLNQVQIVSDPSSAPSYLAGVVSSAVPLPAVSVDLIDAFLNLVVDYDTSTVIQANVSFVTNVSLTGSLTSALPGTAVFDHLVLSGSPGQNASITFHSTMLGRTVFATPNLCYVIQNCPIGSYIVAFQCLPCPSGTYSFSVNSPECTVCDSNVDCTHNDFIAQQGWWAYRLPNVMGVVPCLPSLCVGGKKCAGEQRPDPSVNLLCGRCYPGFSWWNGDCVRCPPLNFSLLFLVLLIAILYVLISRYFSLTSSCEIGIFTYYTQMVSLLFRSSSSSSWLSLFNLSPAQMGVACFFNLEYYSDIVTGLLSPFLLCVVLGFCMCVHGLLMILPIPMLRVWLQSQNTARVTSDGSPMSFVDSYVRAFIYLAVSGYQGITSLVLTSLYVVSVSTSTSDDKGNIIISTVRVLYQFPAIDADSGGYHILFAFAVLLAICVVVGIPFVLLIILAAIRPISMQPRVIARYGGLYEAYSRSSFGYYNSIWVLIRRTIIVTSFQFLLSSVSYQLIVINILFFCYCLIHHYGSPNRNSVDNIVEAISHASLVLLSSLLNNASLTALQSPEIPVDSPPFIVAMVTISILGIYVLVSKAVKFKAIAKEKLGNVIKKTREAKIPSASASVVIAANEEEKDKRSDDEPRLHTPNVLTRQGTVGRFQFIDNPIADPDNEFDNGIEVGDLAVRVHGTDTESPTTKPGSLQLTSVRQ